MHILVTGAIGWMRPAEKALGRNLKNTKIPVLKQQTEESGNSHEVWEWSAQEMLIIPYNKGNRSHNLAAPQGNRWKEINWKLSV